MADVQPVPTDTPSPCTTTATASVTLIEHQHSITTRCVGNTVVVEEVVVVEEQYDEGNESDGSTEHTPLLASHHRTWSVASWQKRFFRHRSCGSCLTALLAALLVAVLLMYCRFSGHTYRPTSLAAVPPLFFRSNGTHHFNRTVIILSVDGFRNDMLYRGHSSYLLKVAQEGVRADYLQPSFPTNSFPNYYTLATGLYPESHGIIANNFYDPTLKDTFAYGKSNTSSAEWWGGEPFWTTAIKQGQRSAMQYWPGSEENINGHRPTYQQQYSETESMPSKVEQLLAWLDMPADERPHLLGSSIISLDDAEGVYGPDGDGTNNVLSAFDRALQQLDAGLAARNLTDIVNLIVVGDHGTAPFNKSNIISFGDFIDLERLYPLHGKALTLIRPKHDNETMLIYHQLRAASRNRKFNVYLREDIPDHLHFRNNPRIPPIVCIISEPGWVFYSDHGKMYGLAAHGYDNEAPEMRSIFIARGPDIQRSNSTTPTIASFSNVNIYNLVTRLLHLQSAPNNGTDAWLDSSGILRVE